MTVNIAVDLTKRVSSGIVNAIADNPTTVRIRAKYDSLFFLEKTCLGQRYH